MNDESSALLSRIAAALERLSAPSSPDADLVHYPAYKWDGTHVLGVTQFRALPAELLTGVDRQKAELEQVLSRHARCLPSHDVLLWGARGTGKSALVKSLVAKLQAKAQPLAIVEVAPDHLRTLPALFARLEGVDRQYVIFIDDIAFDGASDEARIIRSMLDGGVASRPQNVRLVVTSNRRNIVSRSLDEGSSAANPRDGEEDILALADRFGLKLGFQKVDQSAFLAMVSAYAHHFGLTVSDEKALQFAHQKGGPSGRTAWHFIVECAGREGKMLDY